MNKYIIFVSMLLTSLTTNTNLLPTGETLQDPTKVALELESRKYIDSHLLPEGSKLETAITTLFTDGIIEALKDGNLEILKSYGFIVIHSDEKNPANKTILYHPDIQNVHIIFGKDVINIEKINHAPKQTQKLYHIPRTGRAFTPDNYLIVLILPMQLPEDSVKYRRGAIALATMAIAATAGNVYLWNKTEGLKGENKAYRDQQRDIHLIAERLAPPADNVDEERDEAEEEEGH